MTLALGAVVRRFRALLGISFSILLIAMLVTPSVAYVPASFPPEAQEGPKHTVTRTHSFDGTGDPGPGDTITYTGTFDLSGMTEQGATTRTVITVSADRNAPFDAVPTISGAVVECNADRTECTAVFENLADQQVIFSQTATINPDAPNGSIINATAHIKTDVTPQLSLVSRQESFTPDPGRCSGVITFTSEVAGSGAWLMDIKFADKWLFAFRSA